MERLNGVQRWEDPQIAAAHDLQHNLQQMLQRVRGLNNLPAGDAAAKWAAERDVRDLIHRLETIQRRHGEQ